jgi:hypothetical protein
MVSQGEAVVRVQGMFAETPPFPSQIRTAFAVGLGPPSTPVNVRPEGVHARTGMDEATIVNVTSTEEDLLPLGPDKI